MASSQPICGPEVGLATGTLHTGSITLFWDKQKANIIVTLVEIMHFAIIKMLSEF